MPTPAEKNENRVRLAWVALAGAIVVWAAVPGLLTADNDASIYSLGVPPLLLLLGGFLAGDDRRFAWACIAFGIVMDAWLALFGLSTLDVQIALPGPESLWRYAGSLWIAALAAAPFAGAVPAYQAVRGRLPRPIGVVAAAVSVGGLLMGLYLLKELGAFA